MYIMFIFYYFNHTFNIKICKYQLKYLYTISSIFYNNNRQMHTQGKALPNEFLSENKLKEYNRHKIKMNKYSTIEEEYAAHMLVNHLKDNLDDRSVFLEINPGKGILTKYFLSMLNNKIILFQPSEFLENELEKFRYKADKIIISHLCFEDILKYFYRYQQNKENELYTDLMNLFNTQCSETDQLVLIGTVSSYKLLYILMICYANQILIYNFPLNPSLLLYIPYFIYASLFKCTIYKRGWRLGIFAHLCYDISVVETLPSSNFHTIFLMKNPSKDVENNQFYLIKFIPKKKLESFDHIKIEEKEFKYFFAFVNYFIRVNQKTNLITALESFIPNIGKDMIKNGFKVYDHPFHLTNDDWIKAYKIFSSHPSYSNNRIDTLLADDHLGLYED